MLPEAYEEMSETVRVATERAATDNRYLTTRDAAAAERAAIETKIVRVLVAVADPPPGLVLTINDVAVDKSRIGETIAVAPGRVVVTAAALGKRSARS